MIHDNRKPSKVTTKDRYGNQVTLEYAPEVKPLDPTALAKAAMEQDMEVPQISMMEMDHPGEPQGSDTVPAWLTPGEFVVNAEAMRMPGVQEQIEAINNKGREVQAMQGGSIPSGYMAGGHIPGYNMGGQIPFIAGPRLNEPQYQDDGGWITEELLDKLAFVESSNNNDAVSPAGAIGKYQWLPSSAKQAGYGVKAFDPKDEKAARKATAKYLKNMQKYHGFTPEETLRAYNWGPGNVIKHKKGTRKDIPAEALNYPGKILGVENIEGVPAPKGMPLPTARPEGLGMPEALPTPRPAQEEAMPMWKALMNEYILGDKLKFDNGGAVPHFDTLAANYEPPVLPSNVKPALTDVPSGHHMFGGNQNLGGVETNDPIEENAIAEEAYEPSFLDKYVLGPATKDPRALTESDKGFLDQKTSESELLASDQLAEEENQIADEYSAPIESVEDDIIEKSGTVDNSTGAGVDDMDPKFKKEVTKETKEKVLNKVANIDNKDTGPGSDQGGKNTSEENIVKAAEGDPSIVNKAAGFLKEAFGDLFDGKELGRMAILYGGSRLLGYSHNGSLKYAAKQYLTRVDSNAANHEKYVQELLKGGKYDAKSVAAYKKSKDINDLIPVGTPVNPTGQFKTFYNNKGQKVRAQQVKAGKSTYWVGANGQKINSSYTDDASSVRGTKEYGERIKKDTGLYKEMIGDLRKQFGTTSTDHGDVYATELAPSVAGGKIAKWAADNKVPAEYMGSIVENAYHSALAHSKNTGEKVRDLTPFLEEQYVVSQVGDSSLFKNEDGKQISGTNVSKLLSTVQGAARRKGKLADTPTLISAYRKAWNALEAKDQKLWNAKATDEENGFMKFVIADIHKSIK